jgi:hypothetical protein
MQVVRLSGAANNRAAATRIGRLAAWVDLETEGVADSAMRGDELILGRRFVLGDRVAAHWTSGPIGLGFDAIGLRSATLVHRSVLPLAFAPV